MSSPAAGSSGRTESSVDEENEEGEDEEWVQHHKNISTQVLLNYFMKNYLFSFSAVSYALFG